MRYRMEVDEGDELIIRNVETDLRSGSAFTECVTHPDYPNRLIVAARVFNCDDEEIATILDLTVPSPLSVAAWAVANHEAYHGYPALKVPAAGTPEPDRVERLLGTVLADIVSVHARGLIEHLSGGGKGDTKEKCADLIAQLHNIWYASRFGSFDGERRVLEPYFSGPYQSAPRISFAAAAQHYGMEELRKRFPDENEAKLKAVLSWPLELLRDVVEGQAPPTITH